MNKHVNPLIGRIHGTGQSTHLTMDQARRRARQAQKDIDAATEARRHLWVAMLAFRCDPRAETGIFDSETLLGQPEVGCFICEQHWSEQIDATECPGAPGGPW